MHDSFSRRDFLATSATLGAAALTGGRSVASAARPEPNGMLRVAAVNSVYWFKSHAYHIEGRILDGYRREGVHHQPRLKLVRMFNDQYPPTDMSRELCKVRGVELCSSIAEALGGGAGAAGPLDVDAVLLICEHGDYKQNELGPALETPFREGLSIFGFDPARAEIYLFHALEALECMWERRKGGETGIAKVRCLEGPAVWKAADDGAWSWKLLDAALARCPSRNVGNVKENVRNPQAVLIEYRDGTRATVLNLMEQVSELAFAATVDGQAEPTATCFILPPPPGAKFFDPLTWHIERFFTTGKPPYPIERTLLTTTVCDLALQSLHAGGREVASPALDIRYAAPADSGFFRGRYTDE
jgi:hypothetical protein